MHNTPGRCTAVRAEPRSSPLAGVAVRADASRTRVAVVGFQGFGNVGDEAILVGIERLLGDAVRVTTVFAGDERPVVGFEGAARRWTFHFLPTPRALRALARSDVLLISGGGLMNDYWSTVIPRYLAWVLAARLVGCRVVWVGAGVGPIRRRWQRWLAGAAFAASRLVTVRDEASRDLVLRCAPGTRVEVVPDPAWFAVAPAEPKDAGSRTGRVGIILRAPAPASTRRDETLAGTLLDALATLTARLAGEGREVELITMHDEVDAEFVGRTVERCRSLGAPAARVSSLPLEPGTAVRDLAGLDTVVTVRLHGLILAALAGLPAVSIRYDPKVAAAASDLGLGDLCLPLEGLTSAALATAVVASSEPGRRAALAERVAAIRSRADEVRALIATALP